jgi:hypothetical protein
MSTDHGSPHFGHWCLGALFALLALAAGAIALSLNITFGLQTSVVAALVFTLSDCAKILLPMVSACEPACNFDPLTGVIGIQFWL